MGKDIIRFVLEIKVYVREESWRAKKWSGVPISREAVVIDHEKSGREGYDEK